MSTTVECPYCEKDNDVTGYDPVDEGVEVETECDHCSKEFVFWPEYSVDYYSRKKH